MGRAAALEFAAGIWAARPRPGYNDPVSARRESLRRPAHGLELSSGCAGGAIPPAQVRLLGPPPPDCAADPCRKPEVPGGR